MQIKIFFIKRQEWEDRLKIGWGFGSSHRDFVRSLTQHVGETLSRKSSTDSHLNLISQGAYGCRIKIIYDTSSTRLVDQKEGKERKRVLCAEIGALNAI